VNGEQYSIRFTFSRGLMMKILPEGYTKDHDSTVWNIGFVFRYSDVYEDWLQDAVISVRF